MHTEAVTSKTLTASAISNYSSFSKAEKGEKEDWIIQKRFQDNKERREKENAKNKERKKIR